MAHPRLLIAGNSFAADQDPCSWTKLIHDYHVTNISACGVGEYKIWQALIAQDIAKFDKIIVVHTSAAWIHIKENPWYIDSKTHAFADLIYSDVCNKPDGKFKTLVTSWFEQVVDLDYQDDIHAMIVEKIQNHCAVPKTKHITFFDHKLPGLENLNSIWKKYPGTINHLSAEGNQKVFEYIQPFLYD